MAEYTISKIKLPNNDVCNIKDTWRGIQDNLTSSTNTTESLSAKQGYLLANGSARDSTKVSKSGDTMTSSLTITKAGECGVEVNNTQSTNPNQIAFIVDSSGNGGIYSRKHTKWIVYADASGNVVLNGNAATATTATNLAAKPSLATSGTTQITVTAGGKTSDAYTIPYATKAGTGSTVTITSHTNTTNGNKTYYLPFLTATSGNLSPRAHSAVYLYETVANGAISKYDFCFGASTIKGSITLWDGTSHYGNIRTDELSSHRTYDLPNASGTLALTSSNITGNAANVTGTVAVDHGGTGATTAADARTNLGLGTIAVKADTDYVSSTNFTSTNSTSKLYLIGAISQAANPTTNSYQYTYTNNGLLSALKLGLNLNGTEKAHLEWNNTDQSIDFIFN